MSSKLRTVSQYLAFNGIIFNHFWENPHVGNIGRKRWVNIVNNPSMFKCRPWM
jgi:hypothetical protein